jgi:asparagine synthetase B (glutamine-hydrolysing)
MNNLIYFSTGAVISHDSEVTNNDYQYHNWFNLTKGLEWPSHTTSRVHQLNTPWALSPTVCPIPKLSHNEENFDNVIDSIAEKFCQQVLQSGRTPYIAYSGGIDSTSILVSLLKINNTDFLKKLVVLHNKNSIKENPYFYHRFIENKLQTQDINCNCRW